MCCNTPLVCSHMKNLALPVEYVVVSQKLLFTKGEDWQQTRRLVSPTFSSGKLKMVSTLHNVVLYQPSLIFTTSIRDL